MASTHHVYGVGGTKRHKCLHPHMASNVPGQEVVSKITKNTLNAQVCGMTDNKGGGLGKGEIHTGTCSVGRPQRWRINRESASHKKGCEQTFRMSKEGQGMLRCPRVGWGC